MMLRSSNDQGDVCQSRMSKAHMPLSPVWPDGRLSTKNDTSQVVSEYQTSGIYAKRAEQATTKITPQIACVF
jgi:hypothetical protein